MKILYNALVRSLLEATAIIGSPQEAKYSLMVEKIQKKNKCDVCGAVNYTALARCIGSLVKF